MFLTKQQRIEIILMSGSSRKIAEEFNRKHRTSITSLLSENGNFPAYFQQDSAPPHYDIQVRQYLNQILPDAWIGRRGPDEWPPRSPDLTPLYCYLWGHLKAMVYQENIRDINHLKDRIINSFAQISSNALLRVYSEWVKRIMMCIQNNDGHIEPVI